jgi:N-acetylglutamate synthase-like GNAT family acetyltransferase
VKAIKEKILAIVGEDIICHFGDDLYGEYIVIIEKSGAAMARVSWYSNNSDTAFLDFLSVSNDSRNKGFGTSMQAVQENISKAIGAKYCRFLAEKDKWMHDWYKRRGYVDCGDYNEKFIWMQKEL